MELVKRKLQHSNQFLSPLCLGTMRYVDKGLGVDDVVRLFREALELGVTSHHVSSEYASFELVCEAYHRLRASEKGQIELVVKLADPHFGEEGFDSDRFKDRIDHLLQTTGFQSLAVVQWMWRQNPMDDQMRIGRMESQTDRIHYAFDDAKNSAKVSAIGCFPYTQRFMQAVKEVKLTEIEINYFNLLENASVFSAANPCEIAIRPLGGGELKEIPQQKVDMFHSAVGLGEGKSIFESAIQFPLYLEQTASVVLSINRLDQLKQAVSIVGNVGVEPHRFSQMAEHSHLLN